MSGSGEVRLQPWRKQISLIKLGKGDNAVMLEPRERISAQKIADRVYWLSRDCLYFMNRASELSFLACETEGVLPRWP